MDVVVYENKPLGEVARTNRDCNSNSFRRVQPNDTVQRHVRKQPNAATHQSDRHP